MAKIQKLGAGEFKSKCLQLMDDVQKNRKSIIITKRGKPVAKLVPVEPEAQNFFGCLKGSVRVSSDIIAPIDVDWEANE
jgi:prevent-host-death family protein